jgi:ABC-type cobalamin/Fe3+-siderophores transport system ATPase subunit
MVKLLEAKDLVLDYPGGVRALDSLSLDLEAGEIHAVLGPNGAGKSSLLAALLGLHALSSGECRIQGKDPCKMGSLDRARRICLVLQGLRPPESMRVVDLVLMGRHAHLPWIGGPGSEDRRIVQESLALMDLSGLEDRLMGQLSGGERQRVLLARALAQESPIILLDEPTSSLDPGHSLHLLQAMQRLVESRGRSLLWVTHDLNLASLFSDRISLLHRGRCTASGSPGEVLEPELLTRIYGGEFLTGRHRSGPAGEDRPWALPWLVD